MVGQFIARVAGVAGLIAGSQAPGFSVQYMQNLSGRVDELKAIVAQYDAIVADLGTTRAGYIDDLRAAGRESTDKTADVVETTYARYETLSTHLGALDAASAYQRPLILAKDVQRDIAEATLQRFEWSIPLTPDGFAYALGTGTLAWGGLAALFGLLGGAFGMGRRYA